ncbi:MAG: DPP IV N-terminal domain-containing protein, partial [Saprospiraceae bacterium]
MMNSKFVWFFLSALMIVMIPQVDAQRKITIDDLWSKGVYRSKGVPGFRFMNDGRHYTAQKGNYIIRYDFTTGELVDTILDISFLNLPGDIKQIDGYSFSDDETQIMLTAGTEGIYRYSSKEWSYIYNRSAKKLESVHEETKQMHATYSPDGKKVGFVVDNDLYYKDLLTGKQHRVTTDGEINKIINGSCDWVYEEEFSFTKAFQWSPDSRHLAYYRFDESNVKDFSMTYYTGELYPEETTFKYPKVGMENSKVSIHLFDTHTFKKTTIDRTSEPDGYIPRIKWTKNPSKLCVFWMNRHQNHLELLLADVNTGKTSLMLEEENKYYIDIHDNLTFLSEDDCFIWTSEKVGFNHIYLYGMDGSLKKQLTSGSYDVTSFYGVDEKNKNVYYQAAAKSPMEREVYSVDLKGQHQKTITDKRGMNNVQFSTTFDHYTWTHSDINTAATISVYDRRGKLMRILEDNANVRKLQEECQVQHVEFYSFTTPEGVQLNGYQIKPYNFNPAKKYPVLMYLYGGPGSQEVLDEWMGAYYWWFQSLAQQGYVISCVDNRGTGGRGEEFKKMT